MDGPGPPSQDELALIRQELRLVQQKRREEGAKQEPNGQLLNIYAEDIKNLTAREERLMEGARAMQLEAQAPGGRPRQQTIIWVKACKGGPTVQVAINDGRLDVARNSESAAPKLRSYWAHILPVATVDFFSPAADNNGLPTLLHTSDVEQDGYASLDIEKLVGLGQSNSNPVLLKFGINDVLPTWSRKTCWRLIAVVAVTVGFVSGQSFLEFLPSPLGNRTSSEPPAALPA